MVNAVLGLRLSTNKAPGRWARETTRYLQHISSSVSGNFTVLSGDLNVMRTVGGEHPSGVVGSIE